MVINTQLVKIVHMISMLNNVDVVKENTTVIDTISHQPYILSTVKYCHLHKSFRLW